MHDDMEIKGAIIPAAFSCCCTCDTDAGLQKKPLPHWRLECGWIIGTNNFTSSNNTDFRSRGMQTELQSHACIQFIYNIYHMFTANTS